MCLAYQTTLREKMNRSERVKLPNVYLVVIPIVAASALCLLTTSISDDVDAGGTGSLKKSINAIAVATRWFMSPFHIEFLHAVQLLTTLLLGTVLGCVVTFYVVTESKLYLSAGRRSSTRVVLQPTAATSCASVSASLLSSTAAVDGHAHEVGVFLSEIISHLWDYADQALMTEIKSSVEPQFKNLPGPLSTLRFSKLDLGSTPIRFGKCAVSKQNAAIQIYVDVEWVAKCEIELVANVGDAFTSMAGIESISIKGRLSILLTPTSRLPIVSSIQIALINQPQMELAFTGLAQQVYAISPVQDALMNTARGLLGSNLVLPHRLVCTVDPSVSFLDLYQPPIGILHVRLLSGRNVEATMLEGAEGEIDQHRVYCKLTLGDSVWRSTTITGGGFVSWSGERDVTNFILTDENQTIDVQGWEEKGIIFRNDVYIGGALLTVGQLLGSRNRSTEVELIRKGVRTGKFIKISAQLFELTNELTSLSSAGDNGICGVIEVLIGGAFNVPDPCEPVVSVAHGDTEFIANAAGVDENDPNAQCRTFNKAFHIKLSPGKEFQDTIITVLNQEEKLDSVIVRHNELFRHPEHTVRDRIATGDTGLELEYSVSLRGVDLHGRHGGGLFDSVRQILNYM
mmetsp:Transcript_16533/g.35986  ORF Transcript_16533/g.35986 Transcript_16533/m.35986 type:complete len:627 (+) Transcript_16533:107-1987(+)